MDHVEKKVLFVITSQRKFEDSPRPTGYWLEEVAACYEILTGRGIEVVFASPKGGECPIDPESLLPQHLTYYTENFNLNVQAQEKIKKTFPLEAIDPAEYDAVFYPGGYGVLFDLVRNIDSIRLIERMLDAGKPIAFISHSLAALRYVQDRFGNYFLKNAKVTGFRDSEEAGVAIARMFAFIPPRFLNLSSVLTYFIARLPTPEYVSLLRLRGRLPFLIERMLKREGAQFKKTWNWRPFIVESLTIEGGHLLTGQNQLSAPLIAGRLAEILLGDEVKTETKN